MGERPYPPPFQPAFVILPNQLPKLISGAVEVGTHSYVNVEWVSMLLNMEFNNLKFRYVSTRILTPSTFT